SLRPGTDVGDDLGGAEAAEAAGEVERAAVGHAVEEAAGVEVAGAGGVDDARERRRRDLVAGGAPDDEPAPGAPGQPGDLAVARGGTARRLKIAGLVERADLDLVRKEYVDVIGDQLAEVGAVPLDAEGIRERETDLAAGGVRDLGGRSKRRLRAR